MLFDQISKDIMEAMKAKDAVRRDTLRNVKKEFIEAKTAEGSNGDLTDDAALKIIAKMVKKGEDAAEIFRQQNRQDLADEEMAQVNVLKEYLPKALSVEEVKAKVQEIVAQVGATGPKDMGKVMGVASKALAGQSDGRTISTVVKEILAALG
jgi:hypothetical protein